MSQTVSTRECSNPTCSISSALASCGRCLSVGYCSKQCQRAHWKAGHKKQCKPRPSESKTHETVHEKLFEKRDIPGKGRGLVALRDIKQGELIIREKPLITGPSQAYIGRTEFVEKINSLTKDKKKTYKSLSHPNSGPDEFWSIFQTNCIAMPEQECAGIFPTISFINHSCAPNVRWYWNDEHGEEFVVALRDIPKGSEILESYVVCFEHTREERQSQLQRWAFECKCPICELSSEDLRKSDERRKRYSDFDRSLAQSTNTRKSLMVVKLIEKIVREEFDSCPALLHRLFNDKYQLLNAQRDFRKAAGALLQSVKFLVLSETKESHNLKRSLEKFEHLPKSVRNAYMKRFAEFY